MDQDARMKLLRDVAIRHLVTVDPASTLRRVSQVMTERGVGCAIAVEKESVAGIITERDILHAVAKDSTWTRPTVADVIRGGS